MVVDVGTTNIGKVVEGIVIGMVTITMAGGGAIMDGMVPHTITTVRIPITMVIALRYIERQS